MALKMPKGTQFGFAPIIPTQIPVTAFSKAAPPLASVAAGAVDEGDIVLVGVPGWPLLNNVVSQAGTPAGGAVPLTGLDTTDAVLFPGTSGAGFLQKAGDFIDFTQQGDASTSGGDQQYWTGTLMEDPTGRQIQIPTFKNANLTHPEDAFATARRLLADCEPRVAGAGPRHISEFARMSAAGLLRRYEQDGLMTGIPTGYQPLDDLLGGWQETDLIIVAARPSVGKSAFTMQSLLHATSPGVGRVGLFASLEMSGEQLSDRAISHLGRINAAHIRQPKQMEPDEWPRSSEAFNSLQKLGLFVDDASGMTVEAICARARQLRAAEPLALIAIDYLTYIDLPKNDTQEQGIQHVTRTLKGLAKELRVPVILLSQLNRDGDDEPELKHLRGSGAIEQDADVVIFLHRPNKADRSTVKAKVAKHRNGALGEFYMHADMAMQRFTPMDAPPPPPAEQAGTLRRSKPAAPRARQGRQIVGGGYDD